jgi:homoserine O-acetyltransferase
VTAACKQLQQQKRCFAEKDRSKDEEPAYASGDLSGYEVFHHKAPLPLQRGGELPEFEIAYETWGELNHDKNNAIFLHCGLSASSHAKSHVKNKDRGWWENFIGPGKPLDTNLFYIICSNNLGGCFGSTGPGSTHPGDGKKWGSRFPRFEVQDQVKAQFLLLDHLGIQRLHASVGASLGGMQSVCAAAMFPERVGKLVSISACAKSAPQSVAFRHSQRCAIMGDANWKGGDYYESDLPAAGLTLARQIGTITYRSGQEWQQRNFAATKEERVTSGVENEFEMEHYLAHQGKKWVGNFDPNSMIWISKAMDGFSMEAPDAKGRPSLVAGLAPATMPALVIGVKTDILFPMWQQKEIADTLRNAGNKQVTYYELDSIFGHDGFLLEQQAIGPAVKGHLEQEPFGAAHLWEEMAQSASLILQAAAVRTNKADTLRDIWRTLAAGSTHVEASKLKQVLKATMQKPVTHDQIDKLFLEQLPQKLVTLDEFLILQKFLFEANMMQAYEI